MKKNKNSKKFKDIQLIAAPRGATCPRCGDWSNTQFIIPIVGVCDLCWEEVKKKN